MANGRDTSFTVLDVVVLVYYCISVVLGLALVACGSWFHASKDVYAYMTIFVRSPYETSFLAAAALILVAGIVLVLISVGGILGIVLKRRILIIVHLWVQLIVLIFCLVAGFIAVALYWEAYKSVKAGMMAQLTEEYADDTRIGRAWNRVQVKKRCCGVDGPWNYKKSQWFADNNPIDSPESVFVPKSCCRLHFNQDQWLYWVDPEDLQIQDYSHCQEDAAGKSSNSANVHNIGCYASMFQVNRENMWHDVTIWTVITVIEGLGLGIGFLQIVGIVLDVLYKSQKTAPGRL